MCPRRDRFIQKANEVNQSLAGKCGENGFNHIPHNINTRLHLNRGVPTQIGKVYTRLAAILKIMLIMDKIKSANFQSHL